MIIQWSSLHRHCLLPNSMYLLKVWWHMCLSNKCFLFIYIYTENQIWLHVSKISTSPVILTPGETTSNSNSSFALTDAVKFLSSTINTQFQQLAEKLKEDSTKSAQLLKKKLKNNTVGKLKFEGNDCNTYSKKGVLKNLIS